MIEVYFVVKKQSAFTGFLIVLAIPVAAGAEPPVRAADGELFDWAWIRRGEPTTQRFEGKSKLDGWQYPSSVVW